MRVLAALLRVVIVQAWTVNANVEKTIFLGPNSAVLPNDYSRLDQLHLPTLSPASSLLPAQLSVQFPQRSMPRGLETWYLLQHLEAGRRYEVRICWPATQPTDFWLDTYSITHVFNTPILATSLAHTSQHIQEANLPPSNKDLGTVAPPIAQSVVLLRIQAAASYYSTNRTLMEIPELVDVDIILDPFLLNVLPQSLGLVAIYVTVVAIGAWFLSGYIYRLLLTVATTIPANPHID